MLIPTATRTGYTFNGWFNSAGKALSKDTLVQNKTFTASWTANSYTVTYNANGGSVSTASRRVTFDSTYGTMPTPTRTGYIFDGWFTAASGGTQITSSTKVSTANDLICPLDTGCLYIDI